MKKSGRFNFIMGFVIGGVMFSGMSVFAAGIMAEPATSKLLINGKEEVTLNSYLIEGQRYFQLNDIAEAVGFEVTWDDTNQALIQSNPVPASGYGTTYAPLKTGDIVKTVPVESSKGSVGGDYIINKGMEDKPWKTSDGVTWPNVPLPEWQAEWNNYPKVDFPNMPPVHFKGELYGRAYDRLLMLNHYEIERMVRTIYKYAGNNPSLWNADGSPNFSIKVEYADDMAYNTFYPWRDWEIEKQVKSTGAGNIFRIYAYDTYNMGEFIDTEYFIK